MAASARVRDVRAAEIRYTREKRRETWELTNFAEGERNEMVELYTTRGMREEDARRVAEAAANTAREAALSDLAANTNTHTDADKSKGESQAQAERFTDEAVALFEAQPTVAPATSPAFANPVCSCIV